MDTGTLTLLKLLAVLLLVGLNAFFVAAEFAFVKLRSTQLDALILKGHRRAKVARHLLKNLEACVSATQLGITLCGLGTGAIVRPVFQALLLPVFTLFRVESQTVRTTTELIVGFLVSTFLLIVLGELVPKSLAIRRTLGTSLAVAQPLDWFWRVTFPFIWFLNHVAQWFLSKFGIQPVSEADQLHSDEELRLMFLAAGSKHASGSLGRSIVLNAFDLRHRVVRDVMRPRQEMVVFSTGMTTGEAIDLAEKTRYSRFPLCDQGDLDRTLGVLHIKDLYGKRGTAGRMRDMVPMCRRIVYVPETARLETVLRRLLDGKLHLAVVVDEYGGTMGMLTLENILEELVGQIQDEFDQETPLIMQRSKTTWELDGRLPVHELEDLVGQPVREEGITTVNGLVTQRLGGFPREGNSIPVGEFTLRVEEVDGWRVVRLTLVRQETPTAEPDAESP
jgi:CBS domain containing-hemolysin-like protein